jgi:hypothetical protein
MLLTNVFLRLICEGSAKLSVEELNGARQKHGGVAKLKQLGAAAQG